MDVDVEVVFLRERLDFRAVRFVGVVGGIFRLTYPSKPPSHAQRGDIKRVKKGGSMIKTKKTRKEKKGGQKKKKKQK